MRHPVHAPYSSLLGLALVISLTRPAAANWPSDPLVNVPLSTATRDQIGPRMIPDGTGGAIVTWDDGRAGGFGHVDIYAQHVTASGQPDPAWPVDGRALCTATGDQNGAVIATDGAGGAIVAWQDDRAGGKDIYAQHVMANGIVDPAWPANGRAVNTGYNDQNDPAIVSDGVGGALVAWQSIDNGGRVYAQRVLASGVLDPAWPAVGVGVCTDLNSQGSPMIVADGAGGAVVAWIDGRNGSSHPDLFAQRVLASGTVDPAWPAEGRGLCATVGSRWTARMTTDGAGGGIVVWREDYFTNRNISDVYAQHVTVSGVVDPAWPGAGRALCVNPPAVWRGTPVIAPDGAAGAIVAWQDGSDIYTQHVQAGGATDPAWPADGRALCTDAHPQDGPTITADGAGGVIVAWNDYRHANVSDIYAQHALAGGTVDPAWPVDGRAVCTAASDQLAPVTVEDTAGGAILAWDDFRGGGSDIYAQRVQANGDLGGDVTAVLLSLASAEADDRGVRLEWFTPNGVVVARVYRRVADAGWLTMASVNADGSGRIAYEDRAVEPGGRYGYRLGVPGPAGERYSRETWVTIPTAPAMSLEGLRPNPADRDLIVSFSLPSLDPAIVELVDLSGRIVASHVAEGKRGRGLIKLRPGGAPAPGIYFVRLTQRGRTITRKACVVR